MLLDRVDQKLLGLSDLVREVLLVGEQFFEVDELLVDEHASDAAGKFGVDLSNDGVDRVANEVLSVIGSLLLLEVGNVDEGEVEESKLLLLLLGMLALVSLREVSVASPSASASVGASLATLVVRVALVALVSVGATAAALELVGGRNSHES